MEKKFVVRPKNDDDKVIMTIRIEKELQEKYDNLVKVIDQGMSWYAWHYAMHWIIWSFWNRTSGPPV
jgi:hypothetical protein